MKYFIKHALLLIFISFLNCRAFYYNDYDYINNLKSKNVKFLNNFNNGEDNLSVNFIVNGSEINLILISENFESRKISVDTITSQNSKFTFFIGKYKLYLQDINKNYCLDLGDFEIINGKLTELNFDIEIDTLKVEYYFKNNRQFKKYINSKKRKSLCVP